MKTRDVLNFPEIELISALKAMKLKELERHSEKILNKYGCSSYKSFLASVIKEIPKIESGEQDRFGKVQGMIKDHLLGDADESVVQRIAVMIMMIISKKFITIHSRR